MEPTQVVSTQNNKNNASLPDVHPCQYCTKPCRGKQCKECHFKMLAKIQAKCGDCDKIFVAARKDGTMRKRCSDCHAEHVKKHYATCPGCSEQYHAILEDGRVFDKCYNCYQKSFTVCKSCPNRTFKGAELCSDCYKASRPARTHYAPSDATYQSCKTEGCKNTTTYTFCKDCNYSRKQLESKYMTYTCKGCSIKGFGDYKFCEECSAQ